MVTKAARHARKAPRERPLPKDKFWYLEKKDWDKDIVPFKNTKSVDHCDQSVFPTSELNYQFNPNDFSQSQLDYPSTKKTMEEILKVPTQRQFERQLNIIRDPDLKEKWRNFYIKAKNAANLEAILHNTAGVAQLAWLPSDPNNPTLVDSKTQKLLGKYVLKV